MPTVECSGHVHVSFCIVSLLRQYTRPQCLIARSLTFGDARSRCLIARSLTCGDASFNTGKGSEGEVSPGEAARAESEAAGGGETRQHRETREHSLLMQSSLNDGPSRDVMNALKSLWLHTCTHCVLA